MTSVKVIAARKLLPEGYTSTELIDALYDIRGTRELACDLEWLMIPGRKIAWPWTPTSLLSMSLTARGNEGAKVTVAFSWPPPKRAYEALKQFLSKRKLIFHNAMSDVIWLLHAGIEPIVGDDTMLLAGQLGYQKSDGYKTTGGALSHLANVLLGSENWKVNLWHRRPRTVDGWLELLHYNAQDTEQTLDVRDALVADLNSRPKTRRNNITRLYRSLLLPAVKPFARMALIGTPINIKTLKKEVDRQERLYRSAIDKFSKATGMRADYAERLANSPTQVAHYIKQAFGLNIESTREDALNPYVKQYPPIKYIQWIRHRRKMKSTYVDAWLRLLQSQGDGRLHSIYLLGVTTTGRLSAELEEGGSMLLVPRDDWMRDLIDADDGTDDGDEWEILAADYSQLELRIVAWLAPERNMRQLFNEGTDLHKATAGFITSGLPMAEFWKKRKKLVELVDKEQRQRAKGYNFGLVFGMQEAHLASYVKNKYFVEITDAEAHDAREAFFELYSDLAPWHMRATTVDFERGWTVTPMGRYREDMHSPTQAINSPIQSTGSDLTMFALTVLDERLAPHRKNAQLVGFVHDCLLVRSRKSMHNVISALIQDSMEHPPLERLGIDKIPVPLVAEVAAGQTWAKAH